MLTDIFDATSQELYEAKGSASRPNVRLALGQLLDYKRHIPVATMEISVLLPHKPAPDLVALLLENSVNCVWETDVPGQFGRVSHH